MAAGAVAGSGKIRHPENREKAAARSCRCADTGQPGLDTGIPDDAGDSPISTLTALAPAKINLYLHVVGRRNDGYHELDSLIAFADVSDIIRVEAADTLSLSLKGRFAPALGNDPENLVSRAAMALAGQTGIPPRASIELTKNLPVASGIGGGSADAAATLRALNILWQAGLDDAVLALLGQSLGADVPVCLFGRTARVRGVGEIIAPGPVLPDVGLLLVNPGAGLSTAAVFSERQGAFSGPAQTPKAIATAASLVDFLATCRNDLLPPARRLSPQIDTVLAGIERQPECLLASLSGSGATCFGIFPDVPAAAAAASNLKRGQPDWWVHAGQFLARTPPLAEKA